MKTVRHLNRILLDGFSKKKSRMVSSSAIKKKHVQKFLWNSLKRNKHVFAVKITVLITLKYWTLNFFVIYLMLDKYVCIKVCPPIVFLFIYWLLLRCSTARGSGSWLSLGGPTWANARKYFLCIEGSLKVENKEHLIDFVVTHYFISLWSNALSSSKG